MSTYNPLLPVAARSLKRKRSLLQVAEEMGNIAKAQKIMGCHCDTFYEIRQAFQVGGVAAFVEKKCKPCLATRHD